MADQENLVVFAQPVPLVFSHLFTPQVFDEKTRKFRDAKADEKGGYDATFLFDANSAELINIKQIAGRIVDAQAYKDKEGMLIPRNLLQVPWEAGEAYVARRIREETAKGKTYTGGELFKGKVLLKSNTIFAPPLSLFANGLTKFQNESRAMAEKFFYPGVNVVAEINLQPHAVGSNMPGVKAYLNELISTNTGDRIAGGQPTEEKFSAYIGRVTTGDPAAAAPQLGQNW